MKYLKQCPFLIMLILSSAIAGGLYFGGIADAETIARITEDGGIADAAEELFEPEKDQSSSGDAAAQEQAGETPPADGALPTDGRTDAADNKTASGDASKQEGNQPGSAESGSGAAAMEETEGEAPKEKRYELRQVDDAYFDDALFIGDSRTVGLSQYGNMPQATFYAETGFTIYKFFTSPIVALPDEKEKVTVEEALTKNQFKKVYLMIGINEMGRGTLDEFIAEYTRVVERIKELQPDAVVILEAIMKVGQKKSDKDAIFNNPNITARNEAIAGLADNKRVFYFDMNPTVVDEQGALNAQYSFDGIHLKAEYIQIWKDFLYTNGVVEAE